MERGASQIVSRGRTSPVARLGDSEGFSYTADEVRKITARWLVPWPCLMSFWGEDLPLRVIAAQLCVTVEVVHDRIQHATTQELALVPKVAAVCASLAA